MLGDADNLGLKQILADTFYLNKDIITIIQDADIRPQLIDLEGKAVNVWSSVLHYASRNSKVPDVIKAALKMQPDNQALKDALEASLNSATTTKTEAENSKIPQGQAFPSQLIQRQDPLNFEEISFLVDHLLACPSLNNPGSRTTLVGMLPADIRQAINYAPQASSRQEVINLVQTCQNFPNGLSELIKRIAFFDKGTIAFQKLEHLAKELGIV